ncbi:MAG TPA: amino acid adenylation domain-containing protein [Umezawaea sp.]|nr:amino acid adenylation domain-containing protein [Umezawaea sp.]
MTERPDSTADGLREAVAGIWCAMLGVDHVSPEDDFFEAGGDSGLAVETAISLRALTGTDLDLDLVYQFPEFGLLLSFLTDPRPVGQERPLTPAEERLWFAERLHPGSPLYHIAALYRIPGRIDVPRLRTALDALVARHDGLRRGFEAPGRAVTSARATVSCRWLDAFGLPESTVRDLIDEHARLPFDLADPPLLRALAVDRGDEDDLLLLTVHHLVCDGASLAILEDDLGRLYSGAEVEPRTDAVAETASRLFDQDESRAYWRRTLAGAPRGIALPHDLPRTASPGSAGAVHALDCPEDLVAGMDDLAARERLSPFMNWIVAYVAGLVALTGERDVVIGIAASSRTPEQRGEIGMFVDPVPLRLLLPDGITTRDLARKVRRATAEALAHRGVPFQTIVEDLGPGGDPARAPLVQAGLTYLDAADSALRLDGLVAHRELLPTGTAKYELLWSVTRLQDRTITEFEYLTGLFSAEKASDVHIGLIDAARAAFARPDAPLRLPGRPPTAATSHNDPERASTGARRPIPELVRLRAAQRPDAPALRHQGVELTYRQLDERAVAIATGLRSEGLRRGGVVAVPLPRGIDSVCAYLGIFYAGCAYLPLDPDQPPDRLRTALLGVADAVLVTGSHPSLPPEVPVLDLEELLAGARRGADPEVPVRVVGEDPAYLISTSGSTGRPKTVVVPHRGISRLVPDAEGIVYHSDDRVAHLCNPAFDASVLELWGALGSGAVLVVGDKQDALSPARLGAFLDEERISVLGLPTALLHTVIDFAPDAMRGVRLLIFGGEKADEQRLARLMAHQPPARVVNVYGPTENTTVSTLQRVTPADLDPGPLSIGRAVSGSTAYALGLHGEPVAPGVEGELYVGGEGLALGYHGNPALTAASFVPDPFGVAGGRLYRTGDRVRPLPDGTFLFVGRTDDQVKVRGFRVELGEIELALRSLPGVTDAVVFARATADSTELLACVTGGADLADPAGIVDDLRTRLPEYMVPAVVVTDRLPLNANGKVDRAALLASLPDDVSVPSGSSTGDAPVDDPLAEAVTALWCESLGTAHARPDDSFVALGGHSIKALKLLARVDESFGVVVDLADFLAEPTLRALVTAVSRDTENAPTS